WHDFEGTDDATLQLSFDESESPLVKGWDANALLAEVMLLEGFPLDSNVEVIRVSGNRQVHTITSAVCGHRLLACFDKNWTDEMLAGLALKPADVFACLDSALSDEQKLGLAERCTLRTI
ncbi:MAG: hypothetical protein IPI92_17680, partial [Gemmatimonadetes bacterium]|nr:hypothetical protein [Gemmatimonadota bacterium]